MNKNDQKRSKKIKKDQKGSNMNFKEQLRTVWILLKQDYSIRYIKDRKDIDMFSNTLLRYIKINLEYFDSFKMLFKHLMN